MAESPCNSTADCCAIGGSGVGCLGGVCQAINSGPVTELCGWGSFGCMTCCQLLKSAGIATGLNCATPIDCTANLTTIDTKSFPGGLSFVIVGDYLNGGITVFQVDTTTNPPGMTEVGNTAGLSIFYLAIFGDPYLYAQGQDAGNAQSLFQFSLGADGSLTPLSPWSVPGVSGGQPVIDPVSGGIYSGLGSLSQYAIQDGGQVASLSPATVSVAGANLFQVAVGPSTVYAAGNIVFHDGGQQPVIGQFTIQSDATLAAQSPATIDTPYSPDGLAVVIPDGGGGPFVYVLGHNSTFQNEFISQYTGASGTLVAQTPESVSACSGSFGLTADPADNLLFVACHQQSAVGVYTISPNGTLTEASWSPATVPIGPGTMTVFRTQ